jgi:hypothetical protein
MLYFYGIFSENSSEMSVEPCSRGFETLRLSFGHHFFFSIPIIPFVELFLSLKATGFALAKSSCCDFAEDYPNMRQKGSIQNQHNCFLFRSQIMLSGYSAGGGSAGGGSAGGGSVGGGSVPKPVPYLPSPTAENTTFVDSVPSFAWDLTAPELQLLEFAKRGDQLLKYVVVRQEITALPLILKWLETSCCRIEDRIRDHKGLDPDYPFWLFLVDMNHTSLPKETVRYLHRMSAAWHVAMLLGFTMGSAWSPHQERAIINIITALTSLVEGTNPAFHNPADHLTPLHSVFGDALDIFRVHMSQNWRSLGDARADFEAVNSLYDLYRVHDEHKGLPFSEATTNATLLRLDSEGKIFPKAWEAALNYTKAFLEDREKFLSSAGKEVPKKGFCPHPRTGLYLYPDLDLKDCDHAKAFLDGPLPRRVAKYQRAVLEAMIDACTSFPSSSKNFDW